MIRLASVVVALGLVACASADPGNTVDAGGGRGVDASTQRDAGVVLADAPMGADAAPTANCTTSMTCAGATMLGTVSGDTGAATLSANGYQAAWYRVRVTEDNSDSIGLALRLEAALTSPTAGAFEVFIYVNAGSDTVECSSTTGTVTNSGATRTVKAEWGESIIPNGADDSRNVTIEVRPAATTTCSPSQSWQLQVDGNWL